MISYKRKRVWVLGWYGVQCAQLYFWKSEVSHLSPWKGYPENWETIWLRNVSPCGRTVLSFVSGLPRGAWPHSPFPSPSGDRATCLFSTESWPERGHKSAQTAGHRLRRYVPKQMSKRELCTKSALPPVSCVGKGGFLFPRVSVLLLYWGEFPCEKRK